MILEGSEILFAGSLGKLHGYYYDVKDAKSVALILPPHPKHGATMKNKVVRALYSCFAKRGFSTLRMNYRGVGYSSGEVSHKDEDLIKDANAAIEWLQSYYPIVDSFWVAGFSSGAWLSMNLVMRRPEISGFVGVALPMRMHDFSFISPCTVPGLILQGDNDQWCDVPELLRITNPICSRLSRFKVDVIGGADFRFSDPQHISAVSEKVDSYLEMALSTSSVRVVQEEVYNDFVHEDGLFVEEDIG